MNKLIISRILPVSFVIVFLFINHYPIAWLKHSVEHANTLVIKRSEFADEDIKQLLTVLTTIRAGNLHISENLANDKRYFA